MKPKILLIDIETKPMLSLIWGLFQEQGGLPMLTEDWSILSWSAKWHGEDKVTYRDQRKAKNLEDESKMLKELRDLLDEADYVIGHNVKKFDIKRINARLLIHGIQKPSSYKVIDTISIMKKHFYMTSNSLEYACNKLGLKQKKEKSKRFAGITLWIQCMAGNQAAWREMELYNRQDVHALEALYNKLIPWEDSIHFTAHNNRTLLCTCGSESFKKNGFKYTQFYKYQRYECRSCGKEIKGEIIPKEEK